VEGARPSLAAIDRIDNPHTREREISSRSASVNACVARGAFAAAGCHRSPIESAESKNGLDQTVWQSDESYRPCAIGPTSALSGPRSNKFSVAASFATPPLITQILGVASTG